MNGTNNDKWYIYYTYEYRFIPDSSCPVFDNNTSVLNDGGT